MKRIVITGLRAGVGATTIAANLIQALVQFDQSVHVIDARPENLLCLHFALDFSIKDGWSKRWLVGESWKNAAYISNQNLAFVPYGLLTIDEIKSIKDNIDSLPCGLLDIFLSQPEVESEWQLILLPSVNELDNSHVALLDSADMVLCVINADIQNYTYFQQSVSFHDFNMRHQPYFVINSYQPLSVNSVDFSFVFKQELAEQCLPILLHHDTSVPDACSQLSNVIKYAPHSQISQGLKELAFWFIAHFALKTTGDL
ncbi:cellulose biosynthesis protein BcsQ [Photobacterium phosphoreum]|jgi:cellulose synthase operon protein YhjQ|uniref:cellulose biosynthesis protein BcsQ n=1 Tax=Photobacterium phosphoreum TaxID=659 RepID=UPI0007F95779|nr:cellulose biosynthesis protein BcsQ [Photobacterium phosphoreum]MCD9517595.1 cellulose synthase operon protein YhjQ [Photobacterium phosphoreum]OBU47638.1 cellulose synthase operon protein YhjQ [Photobacterium phosphoreum]